MLKKIIKNTQRNFQDKVQEDVSLLLRPYLFLLDFLMPIYFHNEFLLLNGFKKKSQFLLAEKFNIPALQLIREIIGCISSLLIRQLKYHPQTLLDGYFNLYNSRSNSNGYTIGSFHTVTSDYGSLIKEVNIKFNMNPYTKNHRRMKQKCVKSFKH